MKSPFIAAFILVLITMMNGFTLQAQTFPTLPRTFCQFDIAPGLPTTSFEGWTGTWSPSTISTAVVGTFPYTFTPDLGQPGSQVIIDIQITAPTITTTFAALPSTLTLCQGAAAPTLPTTSDNSITGTWNTTTINTAALGTTTYTFSPDAGQCASTFSFNVIITATITPNFAALPNTFCAGAAAPTLPATSDEGVTGTWSPNAINTTASGTYTFTPNTGQCANQFVLSVTITPNTNPTFAAIPTTFCSGAAAPTLPATSDEGVTGTWSPNAINTTASGTYTFTPNTGQCANQFVLSVTITPNTNPSFAAIPTTFCSGAAAPTLPATSDEGVTGTWSPNAINTTASGTYTFTPNTGQCANQFVLSVTITPNTNPTFAALPNTFCAGAAAPTLPATSDEGITGTWSPAAINTTASGTYTFTPNTGQCANQFVLSVTITPNTNPSFAALPNTFCAGAAAPTLPATSDEGITGTWSPTAINTTASGTYTFTPNTGQCANQFVLSVTITPNTNPNFAAIPTTFCSGAAAPTLPATSDEGITGTWSPNAINTTASGTYTFTPNTGQCANQFVLSVTITPNTNPNFAAIPTTYCQGAAAPILPGTSDEGITGTWSPNAINTTASGSYTFTPNTGQCANQFILNVTITPAVTPTFASVPAAICQLLIVPLLPLVSDEGIIGTWNPPVINILTPGTFPYVFTPLTGQCAVQVTRNITVGASITPTFAAISNSFCAGAAAPTLPAISDEGITGTWSPAAISTAASGAYTFTPDAGQCANPFTLNVTITPNATPNFAAIPTTFCQGAAAPALPATSDEGITGTWSPTIISTTASGAYTFTPTPGQCATQFVLNVTITPNATPNFAALLRTFCAGAGAPILPTTSDEGITGVWSPAAINTSAVGITAYTFTPTAGQCAVPVSINITIVANATPTFSAVPNSVCQNATAPLLPTTSDEGITGTWNPIAINTAAIGTTAYTFTPTAGLCAITVSVNITVVNTLVPTFPTVPASICLNATAPVLPATSVEGVTGTWSPANINTAAVGITPYTFTPTAGQCAGPVIVNITIVDNVTPTFAAIPTPICQNATAPILQTTSIEGITGTWDPATVNTSILGTVTHKFTPNAGQCAIPVSVDITIVANVVPTFTTVPNSICLNAAAPVLPTTSVEGITGTWSPAIVNTSALGSTTYTFTPTAGQCAGPVTATITVVNNLVPTFPTVPASICLNAAAPVLPATSVEGVTGTWSPANINTSAIGITAYTFTPTTGQCAGPVSVNITIVDNVTPTFAAIPTSICQNATAPILQTTSVEGIAGTWSPTTINTSALGSATYTFTPTTGQCAIPISINITIASNLTPTFAAIPTSICQNATAPVLQTTSIEGITGTWSPTTINTTALGSATYTFTPTAGQCAVPVSVDITVVNNIVPSFTTVPASICLNATAPALPATSVEGITGTWSPANINTTALGSATYTFTPIAGQCATPVSVNITVVNNLVPTFPTVPTSICLNATAPVLPTTSVEGVTGTWSPASINTSAIGITAYTFTPTAGQCAGPVSVNITIIDNVTPTFAAIPTSICQNATAPILQTTSIEGITGTWSPTTINTSALGNATYTFTPTAGQCAIAVSVNITIVANVVPTFTTVPASVCLNATAPSLPATSNEGITGTWSPATINTTAVATTVYTFTPTAGQCAGPVSVNIAVVNNLVPTFPTIPSSICQNATAPVLPTTSNEGVTGTWSPGSINTTVVGNTVYTFTPAGGSCAGPVSVTITIANGIVPTFTGIPTSICQNASAPGLPATSVEGVTGTWSPATINTTALGIAAYTFTPAAGQCSGPVSVNITIVANVTPTFPTVPNSVCQNATAPTLPTTSNEGITGTWSPTTINTTTIGNSIYTFTPTSGQCAGPLSMTITVANGITPTFTGIPNLICQNSSAAALPTSSNEGVSGTWNPSSINTSTPGTSVYTFTPSGGSCASPTSISITVTSGLTPTFPTVPASVCQNGTAPSLPAASNEGITGTWSPSSINTSTLGTSAYTFTPSAGSCSSPVSVNITVVTSLVPTFPSIPNSICQNAVAPLLPTTSNEGVDGNWIPTSINTATLGPVVYTFIPTSNACASRVSLAVTVVSSLVPTFSNLPDSICQFATAANLPGKSDEGVSGTWSPSSINTSIVGPSTYTFTPAADQCGTTSQITVVVNAIPVLTMGPDISIPPNGNAHLNVSVTGNIVTYLWTPSIGLSDPTIENPVASPKVTTVYKLDVIDDHQCESNGKIQITVLDAPSKIQVPNAFSPNGDGINDTWVITNLSAYPGATVDVFNRYGQLVFHSENNSKAWDGTFNGQSLPLATYYYVIDLKNNEKKIGGSVTIFK
ncbi:MAG: gliding motility-associated C-terminal domain-containing protein [Bacteroidetes bacterium]|nr:gliding motility-associated C-terminal domain-containing protein [Bacteroidota bacterium]